jgi:hypothetical protein
MEQTNGEKITKDYPRCVICGAMAAIDADSGFLRGWIETPRVNTRDHDHETIDGLGAILHFYAPADAPEVDE